MNRLQQKNDLFFKLGMLFRPLLELVKSPQNYNDQEKAKIIAQYCAEYRGLQEEFRNFAKGEVGYDYTVEFTKFFNALQKVIEDLIYSNIELSEIVPKQLSIAQAAINAVPVPSSSVILEAGTPFSTYCKLKSLCEVDAINELIWIDAYMSATVFYRYLSSLHDNVSITLVTSEPSSNSGRQSKNRWTEFLDVSKLFAHEYSGQYRLIVNDNLHDRWIIFDNKRIYNLGGSVKDAANKDYFTITSVEPSSINLQSIQTVINQGKENF